MCKFIDLTGMTFSRLKVIRYVEKSKWLCECNCSAHKQIIVLGYNLKNGNTKSCGCFQKECTSLATSGIKKQWEPIDIDEHTYGIPLTRGNIALIDKEDYDKVKDYGWYSNYNKNTQSFYAMTETDKKGIRMHRHLLNNPKGFDVDHIDHNTLNNRRRNLRLCTNSQNIMNSKIRSDNSTGFRGVSFNKKTKKYIARIMIDKKTITIGTYITALEASEAYNKVAKELHGEFCYK